MKKRLCIFLFFIFISFNLYSKEILYIVKGDIDNPSGDKVPVTGEAYITFNTNSTISGNLKFLTPSELETMITVGTWNKNGDIYVEFPSKFNKEYFPPFIQKSLTGPVNVLIKFTGKSNDTDFSKVEGKIIVTFTEPVPHRALRGVELEGNFSIEIAP
jgi:hypothetical protein